MSDAKQWGSGHAQTLTCSSGACPAPAPPCQCYDVPPNSNYAEGDYYAHTCGQLINLLEYPPSPGFCDISYRRCTSCPDYDYCAFCTDICCGQYDGYYDGCQSLARPVACIHHEQPHVTCCSAALSLSRRSSHVPAEDQWSHVPAGGAHDTLPAAAWRRMGRLSWGARAPGQCVHPRPSAEPGARGARRWRRTSTRGGASWPGRARATTLAGAARPAPAQRFRRFRPSRRPPCHHTTVTVRRLTWRRRARRGPPEDWSVCAVGEEGG